VTAPPAPGPRPWESLDRRELIELPSPLARVPRFSEWVGAEVWVKRDDYAPLTIAGNKIRKLEYLLPGIERGGYDTLVTVGAAQSNAARATAAVAALAGFDCDLLLLGDRPEPEGRTGNILIDTLTGARIHYTGATDWAGLESASARVAEELQARGKHPAMLPLGYSTPLGVAAFAAAFGELADQCAEHSLEPSTVVHASTSGATHAGLVLGRSLLGSRTRVIGVDAAVVYRDETCRTLEGMIAAGAEQLGVSRPDDAVTDLRFEFLGPGYAEPSEDAMEALRALGRLEGILVDPVYSAKALAGLISMVRAGEIEAPVVFWHTGGVPALFAPKFRELIT
jgi:1-aminocyclopropane-1-carboxylate deaminase/D-cysteine desulfhydrase